MIDNFQEFFTLLRSIFTKETVNIAPRTGNFNYRLVLRYVSFYHPNLCVYIDGVLNSHDKETILVDPVLCYKTFKAVLPKLPYTKINFVKKGVTEVLKEKGITDEGLKHIADYMEISKREILLYISMLTWLKQS